MSFYLNFEHSWELKIAQHILYAEHLGHNGDWQNSLLPTKETLFNLWCISIAVHHWEPQVNQRFAMISNGSLIIVIDNLPCRGTLTILNHWNLLWSDIVAAVAISNYYQPISEVPSLNLHCYPPLLPISPILKLVLFYISLIFIAAQTMINNLILAVITITNMKHLLLWAIIIITIINHY